MSVKSAYKKELLKDIDSLSPSEMKEEKNARPHSGIKEDAKRMGEEIIELS